MSKMGLDDPFRYLKHKLWQKKGKKSNCQFDSRPLKVRNRPDLFAFKWHVIYLWNSFDEVYYFVLDLTSIGVLHKKLWARKSRKSRFQEFWDSQLGSSWESREKWHLGAGPMAKHIEYYKGEGGSLPQVRAVGGLVSPCLLVAHSCTKSASTTH
jgi:hypothetical protein